MIRMRSYAVGVLSLMVLAPAPAVAQPLTISQAIEQGLTGRTRSAPVGPPPQIEAILHATDVVVRGVVVEGRARLSADERNVYTDYDLQDAVVLYASLPQPPSATGMTLSLLGGSIVVDGVAYTQREEGLLPLAAGCDGVFLLRRVDERYDIAGTFYGAFAVSDGRLSPLTGHHNFASEYRTMALDAALDDLLARLKVLRRGSVER